LIVIPAIDLMAGKVVRLERGHRSQATVYADDPPTLIQEFAAAGAQRLHVVDLDGAFEGKLAQREAITDLAVEAKRGGMIVQVGGGIRDARSVDLLLEAGVDEIVLGTLATREPALAEALCRQHVGRVIIAVDERDGKVAVSGWQEDSGVPVALLARRAEEWGATALLHTDVSRDGMRVGAAVDKTSALQREVEIPVYASGGIGSLTDIDACVTARLRGVIVGRALYEGEFTLAEALARC